MTEGPELHEINFPACTGSFGNSLTSCRADSGAIDHAESAWFFFSFYFFKQAKEKALSGFLLRT
jgi:hypothetical protein